MAIWRGAIAELGAAHVMHCHACPWIGRLDACHIPEDDYVRCPACDNPVYRGEREGCNVRVKPGRSGPIQEIG